MMDVYVCRVSSTNGGNFSNEIMLCCLSTIMVAWSSVMAFNTGQILEGTPVLYGVTHLILKA